jgi:transposase
LSDISGLIPSDCEDSMESTMLWTDITHDDCASEAVRYARSDLSNAEWTGIVPPMPDPKPVGCPRKADLREVVNAILHMASPGYQWRMLPKDFQPFTTVQNYFLRLARRGRSGDVSLATVRPAAVDAEPSTAPKASPAGQTGISQHEEAAGECHVRAPHNHDEES